MKRNSMYTKDYGQTELSALENQKITQQDMFHVRGGNADDDGPNDGDSYEDGYN